MCPSKRIRSRAGFRHLLIVLGGVEGLEPVVAAEEELADCDEDVSSLFDHYLNLCPKQVQRPTAPLTHRRQRSAFDRISRPRLRARARFARRRRYWYASLRCARTSMEQTPEARPRNRRLRVGWAMTQTVQAMRRSFVCCARDAEWVGAGGGAGAGAGGVESHCARPTPRRGARVGDTSGDTCRTHSA